MNIRKDMKWVFSFTENHVEFNNSPDVGFHVGFLALGCDRGKGESAFCSACVRVCGLRV